MKVYAFDKNGDYVEGKLISINHGFCLIETDYNFTIQTTVDYISTVKNPSFNRKLTKAEVIKEKYII